MESPPPEKVPKPLGRMFLILLLAPIVGMALAAGISVLSGSKGPGGDWGVLLSLATLPLMLLCSIICGVKAGQRSGRGLGILVFLAILVVYGVVAFAGCGTVMQGVSFR